MASSEKLYYIKFKRGYYLKVETIVPKQEGRRKKWAFDEMLKFQEDWNKAEEKSKYPIEFHSIFEIVDIDDKYEKKQDELELKELLRRENEVEIEQLSMFEVYGEL